MSCSKIYNIKCEVHACSTQLFAEYSAKSPRFKTIHDNYMGYRDQLVPWFRLAEATYDQYVGAALSRQK